MSQAAAVRDGAIFGRLTVLNDVGYRKSPNGSRFRYVLCECSCGTVKEVRASELLRKDRRKTVSCGCHSAERGRLNPPPPATIHGLTSRKGSHYLYTAWKGIKRRCYDKSYKFYDIYGGRGITMHTPWINDPGAFASYITSVIGFRPSEEHTLDRRDNEAGYIPGNLRWASKTEQIHNRRPSSEWLPWGTRTGRRNP